MRFLMLLVFLVSMSLAAQPVQAQESFKWEPYPFNVMLPPDWITAQEGERLLLGLPEDVEAVQSGNLAEGLVVTVDIVVPEETPEKTLEHYVPLTRISPKPLTDNIWVTNLHSFGDRQGQLAVAFQTYLLTASAKNEDWLTAQAIFEAILRNIEAEPFYEVTLTQLVAFQSLTMRVPANFLMATTRNPYVYLVTTDQAQLELARQFTPGDLLIVVQDYSIYRTFINPQSLFAVDTFIYSPDDYTFGEIETIKAEGYTLYQANFVQERDTTQGRVVLLMADEKIYFAVGMADSEKWQAGERDLFQAILETMIILE